MNTVQFHRIRILHVLGSADRGGTETMTAQLVRHMNPTFHNELYFLGGRGPVGDALERDRFTVYYIPKAAPWALPKQAIYLYKILKKRRYDILHLYGLRANCLGRVLGRISGYRRIIGGLRSIHPSGNQGAWALWLDRLTFGLSLGYVSNSQAAIDFLAAHGYKREKFWLIYNGIDTARFSPKPEETRLAIRQKLHVPMNKIVITCIANLRFPKGHQYLIEALHQLKERVEDFVVLLVGDGPLRSKLERLVDDLCLSEQVIFLGLREREEIPQILAITDVFVLSSLREGLSSAIIEAMAAGCPVVATAVGGTGELVVDGKTGFLTNPRDPEFLAKKIDYLLADHQLRLSMGIAGVKRVKETFTRERMVSEYECLYEHIFDS